MNGFKLDDGELILFSNQEKGINSDVKNIKDLLTQLDMFEEDKEIIVRINYLNGFKEFIMTKEENQEIYLEKITGHLHMIEDTLCYLDEDEDNEESRLPLNREIAGYLDIPQLTYDDSFFSIGEMSFQISLNHIELEGEQGYALYSSNVNRKTIENLKTDLNKWLENNDFTIFQKEE